MRRKVALGAVVLLVVAILALRVPILVRWHASRLASRDPNVQAASRAALLALGRPAIDGVYPDLIAQEVEEEASVTSAVVVVGRRAPGDRQGRVYDVVETLSGNATVGARLVASGPVVCPTALTLWRDEGSVELAVLASGGDGTLQVRLAVPLDGEVLPVVAAVRSRLAAR